MLKQKNKNMINIEAFALYFHIYKALEKGYKDGEIEDVHQSIVNESPNMEKYADYFFGFILSQKM